MIRKILFVPLIALAGLALSCTHRVNITMHGAGSNGGIDVTGSIVTAPIFTRYLQDVDLLAGIDSSRGSPPSLIVDGLHDFQPTGLKYSAAYGPLGECTVTYVFHAANYQAIFDQNSLFNGVWRERLENGVNTVSLSLTRALRDKLGEQYPALPPMMAGDTAATYKAALARIIAPTARERDAAAAEITLGSVELTIHAPGPVTAVTGGVIDRRNSSIVRFKIRLIDLLFLNNELDYAFSYKPAPI